MAGLYPSCGARIEAVDTSPRTIFSHRVSAIAKIAVYFLAVILIGAVLSPPIYWLVQALAEHGILKSIADFPFHRYFTRTVQISALVLLVPLLFSLRIRKISEFGIEKNPNRIRDIVVGFVLALLPVILLAWICIHFDVYRIRKDLDYSVLLKIAWTAIFVAIIEEILFRGVLLGLAAKRLGAVAGALLVSAVFAAVHFMRPAKGTDEVVHWWSGFAQLGSAFGALPAPLFSPSGFSRFSWSASSSPSPNSPRARSGCRSACMRVGCWGSRVSSGSPNTA